MTSTFFTCADSDADADTGRSQHLARSHAGGAVSTTTRHGLTQRRGGACTPATHLRSEALGTRRRRLAVSVHERHERVGVVQLHRLDAACRTPTQDTPQYAASVGEPYRGITPTRLAARQHCAHALPL
jgi:hypothetical protein